MNEKFSRLKTRFLQINLNPQTEWNSVNSEPDSISWHLKKTVIPVSLAITFTMFAGYIIALRIYNYSFAYVLFKSLDAFCEAIFTPYVSFLILHEIFSRMGISLSRTQFFKVIIYSLTIFWLALLSEGILVNLVGAYSNSEKICNFLKLLGLYGIFPFWIGMDKLLNIPVERKNIMVLITVVVCFIVNVLIQWSFGFALVSAKYANLILNN